MTELILIIPEQSLILYVESDALQNRNLMKLLHLEEVNVRVLPNGDTLTYTLYNEECLRSLVDQQQNGFSWDGRHYYSNAVISGNPDYGLQTTLSEVQDTVIFFEFEEI